MLLQDGEDVLKEVELFVACARPEIVAMNNKRLFLFVASFVDDRDAALFSERRIRQDHLVFAVFTGERVLHDHGHVCCISRLAGSGPDTVKHEVHATEARDAIDQLDAAKLLGVKKCKVFFIQLVVIANKLVCDEQKTAGTACRITDCKWLSAFGRLRLHHSYFRLGTRARAVLRALKRSRASRVATSRSSRLIVASLRLVFSRRR